MPLDRALRQRLGLSWGRARALVLSGKVTVDGQVCLEPERKVGRGSAVEVRENAPRPAAAGGRRALDPALAVYVDAQVVVVRKPPGISTVPFEDERGPTLDALVRELLSRRDRRPGRAPLGVVHRLDKETSGLVVFTRTWEAKRALASQFRFHTVHRVYLAVAHGRVLARSFRSELVEDRGDGLRGSARRGQRGRLAVTHVEPIAALEGATLLRCRLETGRTHQIRIHLSEAGHPIVGERVYVRGFAGPLIAAPRLMLHAAELGFEHPDGRRLAFEEPMPEDMRRMTERRDDETTGRRNETAE